MSKSVWIIAVSLLPILALVLTPTSAAAQTSLSEPVTYSARYKANANGLSASATRFLSRLDDGSFELTNELQATVLGQEIARLEQRSRIHFDDNHKLITDQYSYRLSGISSDRRSIDFDWEAGTAISREDDESWTLLLQDPALQDPDAQGAVYDPLSHQLALRQLLLAEQSTPYRDAYEFAVIDGDEIETHRYQMLGEEVLNTPLGALRTVKLERVRSASSSRSTVIWLAPDWHYLVARIEQVSGSLQMQLELETAEVNAAAVTAIN